MIESHSLAENDYESQAHGTDEETPMDVAKMKRTRHHVKAPFDLREEPDALRKPENLDFFKKTFPQNEGYAQDGFFFYVLQAPQDMIGSFAGVPMLFSPNTAAVPNFQPIPLGKPVRRKQGGINGIGSDQLFPLFDWRPLFDAIRQHFDALQVPITEVIHWGNAVHIILEQSNTDITQLPGTAGKIPCMYLYEEDMKRPATRQAAPLRAVDPEPTRCISDQSSYDDLRPGVMIACGYLGNSCSFKTTTMGARVRDSQGATYITVAAQGFAGDCNDCVFHPRPDTGREIGRLVKTVGGTDVGLIQLTEGEVFTNQHFASDDFPEPAALCGLKRTEDYQRFDILYLDSPYTGYQEGHLQSTSYRKNHADGEEQHWVSSTWAFTGPGGATWFPDGVCGATMCSEDGEVVSFFQYVFKEGPFKDWCVGVGAQELIDRGYTLACTDAT